MDVQILSKARFDNFFPKAFGIKFVPVTFCGGKNREGVMIYGSTSLYNGGRFSSPGLKATPSKGGQAPGLASER